MIDFQCNLEHSTFIDDTWRSGKLNRVFWLYLTLRHIDLVE